MPGLSDPTGQTEERPDADLEEKAMQQLQTRSFHGCLPAGVELRFVKKEKKRHFLRAQIFVKKPL